MNSITAQLDCIDPDYVVEDLLDLTRETHSFDYDDPKIAELVQEWSEGFLERLRSAVENCLTGHPQQADWLKQIGRFEVADYKAIDLREHIGDITSLVYTDLQSALLATQTQH